MFENNIRIKYFKQGHSLYLDGCVVVTELSEDNQTSNHEYTLEEWHALQQSQ